MKPHYWFCLALFLGLALIAGIHAVNVSLDSGMDMESLLRRYGYYLVLVWVALHGATIVIVAGGLSAALGLDLGLIILCAFVGAVVGDQVLFSFSRAKGEKILERFPRLAEKLEKLSGLFGRHSTLLILVYRFVYGIRNITPVFLGINRISKRKFFFLNLVGAFIWAVAFAYGGFFAGKSFIALVDQAGKGVLYAVLALVLLMGLWMMGRRVLVRAREG